MRLRVFILLVPFVAGACFVQGSPSGSGAGLGSTPSPIEAGGMAGPPSGSSPASGGGVSGGSGSGGGEDLGRGETPGDGPTDPTAGAESPMTIVGTPLGGSRKPPRPGKTEFRLCFHNVTVSPRPGSGVEGALTYDVAGILGTQEKAGDPVEPVWFVFVYLVDLLFPEVDHTTSTQKPDGDFVATVTSPPGRVLRLQIEYSRHKTALDVTLPEENASPVVLDPCGGTEPTDVGPPSRHPLPSINFGGGHELQRQ